MNDLLAVDETNSTKHQQINEDSVQKILPPIGFQEI